jgi:hypothetical protein
VRLRHFLQGFDGDDDDDRDYGDSDSRDGNNDAINSDESIADIDADNSNNDNDDDGIKCCIILVLLQYSRTDMIFPCLSLASERAVTKWSLSKEEEGMLTTGPPPLPPLTFSAHIFSALLIARSCFSSADLRSFTVRVKYCSDSISKLSLRESSIAYRSITRV